MIKQQTVKSILLGIWVLLGSIGCFLVFSNKQGLHYYPELLSQWANTNGLWTISFFYLFLFIVRPLILFPAAILALASGIIFGPYLGMLITILGESISAFITLFLSKWLIKDKLDYLNLQKLEEWEKKLSKNTFLSVLTMRLLGLPFDMVNIFCGVSDVKIKPFILATVIGILPGLISFCFLGGSISNQGISIKYVIPIAIILIIVCVISSRKLKSSI